MCLDKVLTSLNFSQLSKKKVDYNALRQNGEYGTRTGHMGRCTYFYKKVKLVESRIYLYIIYFTQEVLENILEVKIIGPADVLGVDYLPEKRFDYASYIWDSCI